MEMQYPNVWAVLVATVLPMVIGSIWYGPLLGKKWMELMEITEEEIRASFNPMKSYGGSIVMGLVLAFVLGTLVQTAGADGWLAGACLGGMCWLGFVVTFGYQAVAFEGKKVSLYVMSLAYNLVTFVAVGALLGAWQ